MHEYPITEQIVKIAEKNCKEAEISSTMLIRPMVLQE